MDEVIRRLEGKVYINNEYIDSQSSVYLTVTDPADGKVLTSKIPNASSEDLDLAVKSAEDAFQRSSPWRTMSTAARRQCMWKLADLFNDPVHADMMSQLESHSFGRPIKPHLDVDVAVAVEGIRYYSGWCDKVTGETHLKDNGFTKSVRREPIGVVGALLAWNGPIASVVMKAGPALATGNVIILKPSEKTPLGALYAADLFRQAGFPPGVFQVLPGDGKLGTLMASHMRIRKISFTGSISTGKKVQEAAAKSNLKRVTLELGGKSPVIVFEDADLDAAAFWAATAITANCGQYCIAGSRVYVQSEVYDAFLGRYTAILKQMAGGKGIPSDPSTTYGPVADKLQFERVQAYIESGKGEAKLVLGGDRMGDKGYFIHPTVFADPTPNAKVYKEEIFGPVSVVKRFSTEEEVIALANDTEFGLMAGVFTKQVDRAERMVSAIESGTVCINSMMMVSAQTPFGGVKQSGYGSEGGFDSILAYTQVKTVFLR
ncbi:hypothetical protein AYO21_01130 [Fonsecaea monophora]|uniref:aldehyde dehydrogenase (NAD(+)) n=1 Tax=Fonsecaea monophora TaxID=254056 RepID=A0A177FM33_9EURO|nr:hypothetical protein AYO21_01130 [Fonsecaea monophora]OAG44640.1 hypothetical protein AYO21_01130 [Fonsecaea monophora]